MYQQFDYNNCTHVKKKRTGRSPNGKQRWKCTLCGRCWTEGVPSKEDKIRLIGECYKKGWSIKQCNRITGLTHPTIGKHYKLLKAYRLINCGCGRPLEHKGFCAERRKLVSSTKEVSLHTS